MTAALSGVIGIGIRFPDGSVQTSSVTSGFISASVHSLVDLSLTSGRVTYAGTSGLLQDSDKLTFDGTYLTAFSIKDSALTSGRVTYAGAGGLLQDSDKLTFDGTYLTAFSIKDSALNSGYVTFADPGGLLTDKNTFRFDKNTDILSVPYIISTAITATDFYGTFHGGVVGAANKANTLLYNFNSAGNNYVSATNLGNGNTIVARDSNGDFSARIITASLSNSITVGVSGTGLSGTAITYDGSSTKSITINSNATSGNTGGAIVARDNNGDFSARNINLAGPVEVSGRAYGGPSFRIRDASGGMIGFYDDTDPDPGSGGTIHNYTLNMDGGNFGFYFSNVNSPYDLGFQAASIDSYGLFSGTATRARYADLAENYLPDAQYAPGTVLVFGGECEVTVSTTPLDTRVAGVVSTNPAHLMNGALTNGVAVALQGRVPCQVVGTIRKGDMLVTSDIPGVATSTATPQLGTVIGKALENYDSSTVGTIEVVVGRV